MARGRVASELAVANPMVTGSATALMNRLMGMRAHSADRQQNAHDEKGQSDIHGGQEF